MKKFISIFLVVMLVVSLAACGTTTDDKGGESAIASPVELLNTVWATYGETEIFPAAGGDMTEANQNMEGPGV